MQTLSLITEYLMPFKAFISPYVSYHALHLESESENKDTFFFGNTRNGWMFVFLLQ